MNAFAGEICSMIEIYLWMNEYLGPLIPLVCVIPHLISLSLHYKTVSSLFCYFFQQFTSPSDSLRQTFGHSFAASSAHLLSIFLLDLSQLRLRPSHLIKGQSSSTAFYIALLLHSFISTHTTDFIGTSIFTRRYARKYTKPPKPSPTSSAKMQGPNFGALGMAFTVVRGMQAVSLIAIIGMTANFISEMVAVDQAPPQVIVGTLSVVSPAPSFLTANTKQASRPALPFSTLP